MTRYITVKLRDLKFYAFIGVAQQERLVGNEFRLNIDISYPGELFKREKLDTTVSYAEVYDLVKEAVKKEYELLESVAVDICDRVSERWPIIENCRIEILKVAPPISGITGECGIEYFWKKS